jgi:DNA (cytosine-5)-methyltransferase 1
MNETLHTDTFSNENESPGLRMTACYTPLLHGSLFSGIGGFDLAAEWAGWQNAFHCEWNEFGQKILKYYWPNAESYGDITKTDFTIWRGRIDVLTGGFPCQPYSLAGKRKGKEDERHLWPEMLRAIREISPTYIVGENVYGLVNWNGGLVFHEVQTDLENEGYEVQPVILPACAVNAPHKRERVWFIAYASNNGQYGPENRQGNNKGNDGNTTRTNTIKQPERCSCETTGKTTANANSNGHELWRFNENRPTQIESEGNEQERERVWDNNRRISEQRIITHPGCSEWQNRIHGQEQGRETTEFGDSYTKFGRFAQFPITEPTIRGGNDGVSTELDGITFSKWRNESIKAFGNAIVPQVAFQIFKAINMHRASLSGV